MENLALAFASAAAYPTLRADLASTPANLNHMFSFNASFNHNANSWDTSNVTTMLTMFKGATSFSQDLSDWCVSNIASPPDGFDTETTAWDKVDRQPV